MTVGVRRAPLLLAAALLATAAAAGPATAYGEPGRAPVADPVSDPMADRVADPMAGPVAESVADSVVVPMAGQVAVDHPVPGPRRVPKVTVRPPAPPEGVTVGPRVKVPRVMVQRSPRPRVSISMPPGKRRAAPEVTVPQVTVYPDGVCVGGVRVGPCPRRKARLKRPEAPPVVPVTALVPPPPIPAPTPTPSRTPSARAHVERVEPPQRRRNPMNTVLLSVVLVTAITSTTAVAFRARR